MHLPRPQLIQPENSSIKLIALTKDQISIVDADRYEELMQWFWCAKQYRHKFYAERFQRNTDGTRRTLGMHVQVIGRRDGMQVDHINGNTLDNREENLRFVTRQQNAYNRSRSYKSITGFKGVCWNQKMGTFTVEISFEGKKLYLGSYKEFETAKRVRLEAEERYHGQYARL